MQRATRPVYDKFRTTAAGVCLGLSALACSPGNQELDIEQQMSAPVLMCDEATREFYVREAIARKLAYYPDLAAYAGMKEVNDCEQARVFRSAYYEFSAQYPGFDSDQPLGEIPDLDEIGEPDPSDEVEVEVSKIAGGANPMVAFPNSPFVRLTELQENKNFDFTCSGTLIAKRWILTAAHCLGLTNVKIPVPAGDRRHQHLVGYGRFRVEWANSAGNVVENTLTSVTAAGPNMLQLPHPNFMGDRFPNDIALIYLNKDFYDRVMPARVDQGAAMRLSLREVQVSTTAGTPVANAAERILAAGFGDPVRFHLRQASVFPNQIPSSDGGDTFGAEVVYTSPPLDGPVPAAPMTQPALCKGDSGGPAFRTSTVPGFGNVPIMVGTFIGTTPEGSTCPAPLPPPNTPNRVQIWTDISKYVDASGIPGAPCGTDPRKAGCFIEAHMARWIGRNFQCTRGTIMGGGGNDDFIQCWNQQCQTETCGADHFCAHTVRGTNCEQCGDGTCNCIYGQCEPKKR